MSMSRLKGNVLASEQALAMVDVLAVMQYIKKIFYFLVLVIILIEIILPNYGNSIFPNVELHYERGVLTAFSLTLFLFTSLFLRVIRRDYVMDMIMSERHLSSENSQELKEKSCCKASQILDQHFDNYDERKQFYKSIEKQLNRGVNNDISPLLLDKLELVMKILKEDGALVTDNSTETGVDRYIKRIKSERNIDEQQLYSISNEINDLTELSRLTKSLSGQINLLALNATIEAARAGEFGRGFSIVATDAKALSSGSENITEQVDLMVKKISHSLSDKMAEIRKRKGVSE